MDWSFKNASPAHDHSVNKNMPPSSFDVNVCPIVLHEMSLLF